MIQPSNNLSCLPFYDSIEEQNARKWWVYNRIYPLFTPASFLLPFQILFHLDNPSQYVNPSIYNAKLYKKDGTLVADITDVFVIDNVAQYASISIGDNNFIIAYNAQSLITSHTFAEGQYYIRMEIFSGVQYSTNLVLYSEVFTIVTDMSDYIKIEWWDIEDLVFDSGRIVYKNDGTRYKQRLFLQGDIAKPEYLFEEENEDRDGYSFPVKQISEKKYKFNFLASEYLLDVMRFIRMADYIEITYNGKIYKPDSFLITPEWENNGDVAKVAAEFETDTVVKKLGLGYLRPTGGDFNNDFNDDFNNQ